MSVNIKSALPKGDLDGLQRLTSQLRASPDRAIVAVVVLAPKSVTENLHNDDDPWTVTLKVQALEPLEGLDAQAARSMQRVAYETRTGKQPLPLGSFLDEEN